MLHPAVTRVTQGTQAANLLAETYNHEPTIVTLNSFSVFLFVNLRAAYCAQAPQHAQVKQDEMSSAAALLRIVTSS